MNVPHKSSILPQEIPREAPFHTTRCCRYLHFGLKRKPCACIRGAMLKGYQQKWVGMKLSPVEGVGG
jgi:hypothetical protein